MVRPKKQLGQHFLTDKNIAGKQLAQGIGRDQGKHQGNKQQKTQNNGNTLGNIFPGLFPCRS